MSWAGGSFDIRLCYRAEQQIAVDLPGPSSEGTNEPCHVWTIFVRMKEEEFIFQSVSPSEQRFTLGVFPFLNLYFYFLKIYLFIFIQLQLSAFSPHPSTPPQPVQIRGVKLIFTRGHIGLEVAFKGPNVMLGLCKCN